MDMTDAPETWLDEHGTYLYRYALARTRDEHKAEEAVQETLLAALQARDRFSGSATVRTWLVSILKHKIMDMFRHAARESPLEYSDSDPDSDGMEEGLFAADGHWRSRPSNWGRPDELLEQSQFMTILQRCLDALPPRLARLFWLREVMEEESDVICQEMTITPSNLWTMLYRARMGLRQCLDRDWVGQPNG
jgi:RNA polymerase sigma-70 factor (ECF subfamily)